MATDAHDQRREAFVPSFHPGIMRSHDPVCGDPGNGQKVRMSLVERV